MSMGSPFYAAICLGGAALAFVFEIVIVAGLAVIAVLIAAIVMAAI